MIIMGFLDELFNKTEDNENTIQLKAYRKLINSIKEQESFYSNNKECIIKYLSEKINNTDEKINTPFTAEEFSNIIYSLEKWQINFDDVINTIEIMYNKIVSEKDSLQQKQYFYKMFEASLESKFTLANIIFSKFSYILDIFENKELFLSLYQYLSPKVIKNQPIYFQPNYFIFLLQYMTTSRMYYVDEIAFFTNIINVYETNSNYLDEDIIASLIIEDKKKAGLYEVSQNEIEKLERKLNHVKKIISNLEKSANDRISTLNNMTKSLTEQVKSSMDSISHAKNELEITTSNLVYGKAINLSESYKTSVEMIQELIEISSSLDEPQKSIIKKLGEQYLILISSIYDTKENNKQDDNTLPSTINTYLDPNRPLKERLKEVLANKKDNELYHSSIDKIIKEVLNNNAVYLVGPSGSCKTHSVKQVAELLELPLYDFGFVTDEHETFKSYKNVHGDFVENAFYHAFKNGGICFFDEADNSESKALVELNRIIGGKNEYEPYLFSNGELVTPHPNFRVIAAGNTYGEGGNESYSTRERLDFGTIDRLTPIMYYYDEKLEEQILKDYPDMYEFCMAYRKALTNINDEYFFTTRSIFKIEKNLDSNCYSEEEIIDNFFIKNLRIDVLKNIINNIDIDKNNKYYITFVNAIENKMNNIKVRRR